MVHDNWGVLSPLLYSFYINHTVETTLGQNIDFRLGGMNFNIICYADDITVIASSKSRLEISSQFFSEAHKWNLSEN